MRALHAAMVGLPPWLFTGFAGHAENLKKSEIELWLEALEAIVEEQSRTSSALQDRLACVDLDSAASALILEGCNVHIRNGGGATNSANGQGNLIIGYDENSAATSRLGSHNVVLGEDQAYDGVAHLVIGDATGGLPAAPTGITSQGRDLLLNAGSSSHLLRRSGDVSVAAEDVSVTASGDLDLKATGDAVISARRIIQN
jgi:hypothetical protein